MIKFRSVALLAGAALLGTACGPEAAPQEPEKQLSWEEFRASVYQEPWEDGVFIVDNDIPLATEAELREYFEQSLKGEVGSHAGGLAVYYSGGQDIKWQGSAALNITYCVSTTFGSNYSKVVSAMASAAGAWEAAGKVDFIHVSSQDSNCTSRNGNVVFDVNPVNTSQYLARAFFPNSSRRSRNVLIAGSSFGNISPWTLTGVLRHELGHTLGFRHEHTRVSSTGCYEDAQWRGLTPYDSGSVMHYPQCNGSNNGDLSLTNSDKSGAAALYP
ncbi:M57 family metalloprotease [Hyalangium gracile]|uniref:M57 family metalloprotease n=1 Tax=Hyalangium gracile TaxID=394092 RepID=UPI001CCD5057|nr:M57 family metalloprotease [Hyalangium gracile]